jgi:predicted membrane protein
MVSMGRGGYIYARATLKCLSSAVLFVCVLGMQTVLFVKVRERDSRREAYFRSRFVSWTCLALPLHGVNFRWHESFWQLLAIPRPSCVLREFRALRE